MKPTLLLGCTLLAGTALHAQLSFLPYAGMEQSRNTVGYGNGLSAQDINGFFKGGLRTDYRLKGGHTPFVNVTTNPSQASFAFGKDGSLLNVYQGSGLQLRLEAGYQYSSKPIQLGKKSSPKNTTTYTNSQSSPQKKSCGSSYYRSSCGSKKTMASNSPENKNWNMRLQPSVALAYLPATEQQVASTVNGFTYTPGWKTALVPAMGFEFAKGSQRLFTLGLFYTSPIGQKEEAVSTLLESKTVTTNLQPSTASWGVTLGIPFSLAKSSSSSAKPKAVQPTTEKRGCSRYYYRKAVRI